MPKLAYFPWYPAEAAGDGWWRSLTIAEKGLHHELLDIAWPAGGLEKDLSIVARSVGLTRKEFDKLWPRVSLKWLWNGEFLVNPRQEKERSKVIEKSEKAASSADKRWNKSSNANAMRKHSEGYARASDSEYESKSDSSLKEEKKDNEVTSWKNDESFTRLLAAADALKLVRSTDSATLHRLWINHDGGWCSLSGEQRKAAVDGLVFARYPDPAYAPTLEKYLYKKKWLETIRPASNGATDKKPVNFADEENRKNRLMIQQRRERERQA